MKPWLASTLDKEFITSSQGFKILNLFQDLLLLDVFEVW